MNIKELNERLEKVSKALDEMEYISDDDFNKAYDQVEKENLEHERKSTFKAYNKAIEALEELKDIIADSRDPFTDKLDPDTDAFYDKLVDITNEIYSRSLAFEEFLNENLPKDVQYQFKIKKIDKDELELTSGENVFSVYIRPEDDLQDIRYAIEDFVDTDLASDEDDSENITGTEVAKFKYNMETGEGEFEANIFFADDLDESLNEEVKEWEHNGHKFKKVVVDTKDVEVIPGLTIKFNKVEHGEDDVYTRTTWELDRSVDASVTNQAITKHIIEQLGVDDYKIGGWSGAIPLIITIEED